MTLAPLLAAALGWLFVPGSLASGRAPDGNSVLIAAPKGWILVDTGRHLAHLARIRAAAGRRPIVAIVNTHWHLDHTGGNAELRADRPDLPIVATAAVAQALPGFLARSRAQAQSFLASGQASAAQAEDLALDIAATDDAADLLPSITVGTTGERRIAGRSLDLRVAPNAATAADLWVWLPRARLVVAGDLVVAPVPFLDTACPEGWRKALDGLAALPFTTLVPGHGAPMTKPMFARWRRAFNRLLDCGAGTSPRQRCVDGWMSAAAAFIPPDDRPRISRLVAYYIDTRLRAPAAERDRFCPGGAG
jgi:glyoxylase-like metal-dependent hydrolase (beta-lactamase superfamily II)